jgi:hypothetical protein
VPSDAKHAPLETGEVKVSIGEERREGFPFKANGKQQHRHRNRGQVASSGDVYFVEALLRVESGGA